MWPYRCVGGGRGGGVWVEGGEVECGERWLLSRLCVATIGEGKVIVASDICCTYCVYLCVLCVCTVHA